MGENGVNSGLKLSCLAVFALTLSCQTGGIISREARTGGDLEVKTPNPLLVLDEVRSNWGCIPHSPRFTLYDNGQVIFLKNPHCAHPPNCREYVQVTISHEQLTELKREYISDREILAFNEYYDVKFPNTIREDYPRVYFIYQDHGRQKKIQIDGDIDQWLFLSPPEWFSEAFEGDDESRNYFLSLWEVKREQLPPTLSKIVRFMYSFSSQETQPWLPDTFEEYFDRYLGDTELPSWDTAWPAPSECLRTLRSHCSTQVPSHRLQAFKNYLRSRGRLFQFKRGQWVVDWRLPFPGEELWAWPIRHDFPQSDR